MRPDLVVIGVNHRSAPVEVRERFWIPDERRPAALRELLRSPGITEAALLVTCNRSEFILCADDLEAARCSVFDYLRRACGLTPADQAHFYCRPGYEGLFHVFRVASSLDSLVLGEPQITGQMKSAWAQAQQCGATGRFLDAVFQKALNVAKRARSETAIGVAAVSVPYAAVELAKKIFGSLAGRRVMVLGAGKMSELSARYLVASGATSVHVTNRTYENAVALAGQLGGTAVPFDQRWSYLAEADIVISSTGSPQAILNRADAERIHRQRQGRPIFLIDIAVPRDVDPAVRSVPGLFLYDIDDLEQVVAHNRAERQASAAQAEQLVAGEAQRFRQKLAGLSAVPAIVALREALERVRAAELERYRRQHGPLDISEERLLEEFSAQLVRQITGQFARQAKNGQALPDLQGFTAALGQMFSNSIGQPPLSPAATEPC